ncbi:hypothetical protein BDR04DRAFT_1129750 [Suillus decipiens]|nr:hypothetical protein BDR04DRAFT_1129750 [Suillus decipiens]
MAIPAFTEFIDALPVIVQLTIFLNGVGCYGNTATMEDLAEWVGVSIGTVYNCFKWQWVEGKTCWKWCGGFLCKPGWHGEGFFDKNSNYSLVAQVIILPHNLHIVDYVIGVPGSLHDSNIFRHARIAWTPEDFFGGGQWLWADSAYAA